MMLDRSLRDRRAIILDGKVGTLEVGVRGTN